MELVGAEVEEGDAAAGHAGLDALEEGAGGRHAGPVWVVGAGGAEVAVLVGGVGALHGAGVVEEDGDGVETGGALGDLILRGAVGVGAVLVGHLEREEGGEADGLLLAACGGSGLQADAAGTVEVGGGGDAEELQACAGGEGEELLGGAGERDRCGGRGGGGEEEDAALEGMHGQLLSRGGRCSPCGEVATG